MRRIAFRDMGEDARAALTVMPLAVLLLAIATLSIDTVGALWQPLLVGYYIVAVAVIGRKRRGVLVVAGSAAAFASLAVAFVVSFEAEALHACVLSSAGPGEHSCAADFADLLGWAVLTFTGAFFLLAGVPLNGAAIAYVAGLARVRQGRPAAPGEHARP